MKPRFGDHSSRANAHGAAFISHNADADAHGDEIDASFVEHNGVANAHAENINGRIETHNTDGNSHQSISEAIGTTVGSHDGNADAHALIRALIVDRTEIQDWTHNTLFYVGQVVIRASHYYFCIVSHTSGGTLTDAPENNPTHWRRIAFFDEVTGGAVAGERLVQVGSDFAGSFVTNGYFINTSIRPTNESPTPAWLHIRNGLVQVGHGIHAELSRVSYAEWAALPNVLAGAQRTDNNNLVIGNVGSQGGVELYLARTSDGDVLVASSHGPQYDVAKFQVWKS